MFPYMSLYLGNVEVDGELGEGSLPVVLLSWGAALMSIRVVACFCWAVAHFWTLASLQLAPQCSMSKATAR